MYTARETGRDEERQDAEIAEQGKEQANSTQDSLCVDCSENEPSVCQLCPDEAEGIQCTTCISDDKAVAHVCQDCLVAYEERVAEVQRRSRNREEAITSMCEE